MPPSTSRLQSPPPLLLLEIVIAHAQIGLARRHQARKLLGQFSAASPGPRLTGRGEGGADQFSAAFTLLSSIGIGGFDPLVAMIAIQAVIFVVDILINY